MDRKAALALVERCRKVLTAPVEVLNQDKYPELNSIERSDLDALLALAQRGAEVQGAVEGFVDETDIHHVNDTHGSRRRVLILPEEL